MEEHVLGILGRELKKKCRILDAGCGTGGMAEKMLKFGSVTAVDINKVALDFAQKKHLTKIIKASVENLPFRNDSFDTVVCLDVLYHQKIKDDLKALQELYRVLKKGGIIILRLPAFEFLRGAHDIVVETRHRYTKAEIKSKVMTAGFKITKLTYSNMILSVPLFIKRSYERLSRKNSLSSDTTLLPEFINILFYQVLKFENKMLDLVDLPFGSSVVCIGKK